MSTTSTSPMKWSDKKNPEEWQAVDVTVRERNVYPIGDVTFEACTSDHLFVLEDEFRSGYECETCGGKERVRCDSCNGTGQSQVVPGAKCSQCKGAMKIVCPACGGKGASIVTPEVAQRPPTTGCVLSIGPNVKNIRIGDSVLFPDYVGTRFELGGLSEEGEEVTRFFNVIKETDVQLRITGHLELRRMKKKTTIAE